MEPHAREHGSKGGECRMHDRDAANEYYVLTISHPGLNVFEILFGNSSMLPMAIISSRE